MLTISYAGLRGLSLVISVQFGPEMRVAAQNCQKSIKNNLGVQSHPKSLLLMPIESQCTTSY